MCGMDRRTLLAKAAALILVSAIGFDVAAVSPGGTLARLQVPDVQNIAPHDSPGVDAGSTQGAATEAISSPIVDLRGGTDRQHRLLFEAVDRFTEAGLTLPQLQVAFTEGESSCRGHLGLFESQPRPRRITICSTLDFVVAHELGHAWVSVEAGADARQEMLKVLGLGVWYSPDTPWNQRGSEHAAVVIQQSVAGLALPSTLGATRIDRLAAYEALTGRVAPVLVDWLEAREIACSERPTFLSRGVPDATGRECGVASDIARSRIHASGAQTASKLPVTGSTVQA